MIIAITIILCVVLIMTLGYFTILWIGGVTIQRNYSIARSWESKRWTFKRICHYYVLWTLYRLLPGKGKTRFCIPGPTSTSHPFGWIEPQLKQPYSGSDYIITYKSGKTEHICDYHAMVSGVHDLAPIFGAKVDSDTNGVCRECVDTDLKYNFPKN
jgi:hypothetical protein